MIVYLIENLINGKVYIGQTINKLKRRYVGKSFRKVSQHLKRAIQKYGEQNFYLSILEECWSIEELNEREKYWIDFYDSTNIKKGYNLQSGGKNCRVHESTKKLLKENL